MRTLSSLTLLLTFGLGSWGVGAAECNWPAWDNYKQAMMSADGRIIDRSTEQMVTTSEGQSYSLFFALVGNDRASFAKILDWTRNNLAEGSLDAHLPAWQWGRSALGKWQVLDKNNASDADLWLAYTLLEAGRLWNVPEYAAQGKNLLWRSAAQSLRTLPGLGLMLLPGNFGFEPPEGWRFNPSYLPPAMLALFAQKASIWAELAANQQRLLIEGSPKGFAPDWLLWRTEGGWAPDPVESSAGDYDAIRVYLWVGTLAEDAPNRQALQQHFTPMVKLTETLGYPPERVNALTGTYSGKGSVGFSAAMLPLLASTDSPAFDVQRARIRDDPPAEDAYYSRSLMLFGLGWIEQRYRFDKNGQLLPAWTHTCQN